MAGRFPPEPLKAVVEEVASLLKARKETISVAETAAGGLISAALLATPGASGFYKGGLTVRSPFSLLCFTLCLLYDPWRVEDVVSEKGCLSGLYA